MAALQGTNNRPLSYALQITPSMKFWTVLVQCLNKSKQKTSQTGISYKSYLFCDMKGTLISVMTYDQSISKFARLLQPYKRYYISNATVREANPNYQVGDYGYSWSLYNRTLVDPISEPILTSIPCEFKFINFSDMHKHADSNASIAVRALVIGSSLVKHPTNESVRDYILVDKTKKLMLLRLWDDNLDNEELNVSVSFPEPTIIVAVNLKVTTHHGLSLTTKKNSFFLRDPPSTTNDRLLDWYYENIESLKKLVDEEAYTNTCILLPPPNDTSLVRLSDFVANSSVIKAAWVAATIHMLPAQEKLWYSSCKHCGKSFNAPLDWETTCTSCGRDTKLHPRCHIGVLLNDETKTITSTLFSPEAERLIGFTGYDLKEADDKNTSLADTIATRIHKKSVICFVKCLDKSFRGNLETTYPIVKIYTEDEIAAIRGRSNVEEESLPASKPLGVAPPNMVKEKQFFSPKTKLAIEEIANNAIVLASTPMTFASSKRGALFADDSSMENATTQSSNVQAPAKTENTDPDESDSVGHIGKKVKGKGNKN